MVDWINYSHECMFIYFIKWNVLLMILISHYSLIEISFILLIFGRFYNNRKIELNKKWFFFASYRNLYEWLILKVISIGSLKILREYVEKNIKIITRVLCWNAMKNSIEGRMVNEWALDKLFSTSS